MTSLGEKFERYKPVWGKPHGRRPALLNTTLLTESLKQERGSLSGLTSSRNKMAPAPRREPACLGIRFFFLPLSLIFVTESEFTVSGSTLWECTRVHAWTHTKYSTGSPEQIHAMSCTSPSANHPLLFHWQRQISVLKTFTCLFVPDEEVWETPGLFLMKITFFWNPPPPDTRLLRFFFLTLQHI